MKGEKSKLVSEAKGVLFFDSGGTMTFPLCLLLGVTFALIALHYSKQALTSVLST